MKNRPYALINKLKTSGPLGLALFALGIIFFLGSAFVIWAATWKLPTLDSFEERYVAESTKIYDRTGEIVLYDVYENVKRTVVPYEEISQHAKNATIAIEDDKFYEHNGIRPLSFLRAVIVNLSTMEFSQGGSTITQQVIKNSVLTSEKKLARKIKEWVLAVRLEKMKTKDEILNLYLNEIPYGGSLYGIQEASLAFFGKSASSLSIAEAAYLAALPQAPTYYSPYGNHRDRLDERKNLVLKKMLDNGYIDELEYETARAEVVEFKPQENRGIKAPHFVMYVKDYLAEKYGEEAIEKGGYKIITTIDFKLQDSAEKIAKEYALKNKASFNAENDAFVAIDPKTGQILSMVGSRDYFDKDIDGNFNVATANRQPGSTFKPFAYAAAFNKGYTPETVIFDVPTEFSANCNPDGTGEGCYSPRNYDDAFRGPITMRNALAQSINVPSVKTLYLAGLKNTLLLARDMGIKSLKDPNHYGLTLVLGGGEVSLLDMTSAYSVFANQGVKNEPVAILKIEDGSGNILEEFEPKETRILPEETALMISDVLSDNVARMPAYGASSPLYFPGQDVAVKTGTTNDYKDAWIIGYTPTVAIGAWAGNNNNTSMDKKVAGYIVAPMWREFMDTAIELYPKESFKKPIYDYAGLKPILRGYWQGGYSTLSGTGIEFIFDSEDNNHTASEERLSGGIHSILYWINKDDPRGPIPSYPASDPQFNNWEYAVRKWAESQGMSGDGEFTIPIESEDTFQSESSPEVTIRNPESGEDYDPDSKILVRIDYEGRNDLHKLEVYINNRFIGSSDSDSYSFTPSDFGFIKRTNTLRVIAVDEDNNRGSDSVSFRIRRSN